MISSCPDDALTARDVMAARALPGVGDVVLAHSLNDPGAIRERLGSALAAAREAAYATADQMHADALAMGARVLTLIDEEYPTALRDLADAPAVLFAQGALPTALPPAVAIVGTRRASSYGIRVARAIAATCARAGVSVVSGLAEGIDGAAHEAALETGGRTVAVLGTGLGVYYPRRHRTLQQRLATEGLVLSELPPGVPGHGGAFPRRNRLIAALAQVTVVVEAGVGSGALITAEYARELGRHVACVPNAIDVPTSAGSNALLKDYAEPVLSPDDVLAMLTLRATPTVRPVLDADAAAVWDAVTRGATDVVAIAHASALSVSATSAALTSLELEGLIVVDHLGAVHATIGAGVTAGRS